MLLMKALIDVVVVVAAVAQRAGAERRLDVVERRPVPGRASAHATSSAVSTWRPSPPARSTSRSIASARGRRALGLAGRARTSVAIASRSSGSRRNSVLRLRSGGLTSKNGFSVVAPISVSVPSSTAGQQRVLLGLVEPVDLVEEQDRAAARARRGGAGPARSPRGRPSRRRSPRSSARRLAWWCRRRRAPAWSCRCPAGPRRSRCVSRSCSTRRRSGLPGPTRWSWPTTSSSVRGRSRAASGAWARRRSSAAALNRSLTAFRRPVRRPVRRHSTTWSISHSGSTHRQATNSVPFGRRSRSRRSALRTGTTSAPGRDACRRGCARR